MPGAWILMEPYHGGSHRHLADGLAARLPPLLSAEVALWTLPARKWKWRMRGAALHFAGRWRREAPAGARGILATSLLDAAALRGLLPPAARCLPLVLYCHENQLRYPVRVDDRRDYHYAWTNIQSCLAADRVLWNSRWNRDSFLAALPEFLRRLPDHRPEGIAEAVAAKSRVLPVPLDLAPLAAAAAAAPPRAGPCRVLWNHRWEHDKGPEEFFDAVRALAAEGLDFTLSVLGERFAEAPPVFEAARESLGGRVAAWGYRERREDYLAELCRADLVVSTARHEFQGLAVLEAAACGAAPLVPDALAYPEIWPAECRYPPGELLPALRERIRAVDSWRGRDYAARCEPFGWEALLPVWADALSGAADQSP